MRQTQRIAMVGTMATVFLGFRGELVKEMLAAGHQVYAFASDYTDETEREVRALGAVPVSYALGRLSLNPLSELWSCFTLYRLFRSLKIDMTFCYFAKPVIYGTLAAWLAKVPVRVAKIEGLGRTFTVYPHADRLKARIIRRIQVEMYRLSLAKTQHVFLLNPDDQRDLIDHYQIKTGEITQLDGIGVNLDYYPRTTQPALDVIRFIFVGRLLTEKGIYYFLQAAVALKALYPKVEFVILGEPDGKYGISRTELLKYVEKGIVVYPGKVKNVVPFLQQSSVFVLPSFYREGVPRSTQEAMAIGLPIITTDMPGCRETVVDGVNGFLVPPYDTLALQNAMLNFIQHPDLITKMGEQSYFIAQRKFDVKKINVHILKTLKLL